MKLYRIKDKVYTIEANKNFSKSPCNNCEVRKHIKRNRRNDDKGYCPEYELSGKCAGIIGFNNYFVLYKDEIKNTDEVVEIMENKKKYPRMTKGFTRRDVLRTLILGMKEHYGVDIVRKADSVEQCNEVIKEIIEIHVKNRLVPHLEEKKHLDEVNELLNDNLSKANSKLLNKDAHIEQLNNGMDSLKEKIEELEEQLKQTELSRNEWLRLEKNLDNNLKKLEIDLKYQKDVKNILKNENEKLKTELKKWQGDNELLGMWLREWEDKTVFEFIKEKVKRFFKRG